MVSPMSSRDHYTLVFQQEIRAFREKLSNSKSRARVGRDRISELPDAILCHILSFVPTKCAVRTSILATKWKNVWASVPNLYFENYMYNSSPGFVDFVDRVLLTRDNSLDIKTFYLLMWHYGAEDYSRIDAWIRTAIRCNVVELSLSLSLDKEEMFELPESLVTCKSLKVLKLMSTGFNRIIHIPTSGCFPSLKFLHLYYHDSGDKDSMDLSQFPVLEHLTIDGSLGNMGNNFNISAPELKTLSMDFYVGNDFHDYYSFSINAPKLEKLALREARLSKFNLKNSKSLVEVDINLYDHKRENEEESSVNRENEFLASIFMVKHLSLAYGDAEACSFPAFDNLSKLTMGSYFFHIDSWKVLLKLLEKSPNLECIVLEDEHNPTPSQMEDEAVEDMNRQEELGEIEWKAQRDAARVLADWEAYELEVDEDLRDMWIQEGLADMELKAKRDAIRLAKREEEDDDQMIDEVLEDMKRQEEPAMDFTSWHYEHKWSPPMRVPHCVLSHLKTVKIKGFKGKGSKGYRENMELFKYLLKNGRVLEKMTIYTRSLCSETKQDFYSEISMSKWGSETARAEVINGVRVEMIKKKLML